MAVAGVCTRVSSRRMVAFGPRAALASAAVSICSMRPTCAASPAHVGVPSKASSSVPASQHPGGAGILSMLRRI